MKCLTLHCIYYICSLKERAVDGIPNRYYVSAYNLKNAWWMIDLNQTRTVHRVKFRSHTCCGVAFYNVEVCMSPLHLFVYLYRNFRWSVLAVLKGDIV